MLPDASSVRQMIPRHRRWFLLCWLLGLAVTAHVAGGVFRGPLMLTDTRKAEIESEVAALNATADQLWEIIEESKKPAKVAPKRVASEKPDRSLDLERRFRSNAAAREFLRRFPGDARSWAVRLHAVNTNQSVQTLTGHQEALKEIIAAAEAPPAVRHEARQSLFYGAVSSLSYSKEREATEKIIDDYERDFPDDPNVANLMGQRVRAYTERWPDELIPKLKEWTASPNARVAAEARQELALRTEPMELKFTAVDGRKVDLAKMRGSVVFVYICVLAPTALDETLPKVLALLAKYRERGLKMIGVSMDWDRSILEREIKTRHIEWPIAHDRVVSGDSAIRQRFGNNSLSQTAWVLDRTGVPHQLFPKADWDAEVSRWLDEDAPAPK
jgi:hypothetical protein